MTKDNPVAAGVAELLPCPFCGSHLVEAHAFAEKARPELKSSHDYSRGWNAAAFRVSQIARATLSRLKPGEKGGE